jgi:hypothetical protein
MSDSESTKSNSSSFREDIEESFTKVASLLKASAGPINAKYPYQPANKRPEANGSILTDLTKIDLADAQAALETFLAKTKGYIDDGDLVMERLITGLAKLPENSGVAKKMTDEFVNTLWDVLPHPPIASLGQQYKYRTPDGSNNNISQPLLGAAGQPYARSVKPEILQRSSRRTPRASPRCSSTGPRLSSMTCSGRATRTSASARRARISI